jgi:hypothetical protein
VRLGTIQPFITCLAAKYCGAILSACCPCTLSSVSFDDAGVQRFAMLAVGCKAGIVWLWRYRIPSQYSPSGSAAPQAFSLVCTASAAPGKLSQHDLNMH